MLDSNTTAAAIAAAGAGHTTSDAEGREHGLSERLDRTAAPGAGASEAERLARSPQARVLRLEAPWHEVISEFPKLGRVRSVVRNAHAIHKAQGEYGNISGGADVGLVLNRAIDLRLFWKAWRHAFLVEAQTADGPRLGLEVFDRAGDAIQKVFVEGDEARAVLQDWAARYGSPGDHSVALEPAPAAAADEHDDSEIDAAALLADWQALKDVHHFRAMIARHGAGRTQALRLAAGRYATRVGNDSLERALRQAAGERLPIMVFVANRGIVQIRSGPIGQATERDGWLTVADPDFELHVRQAGIAESWVVSKPTTDGPVTSLELYDATGETVLQMFGVRREGEPELTAWRSLTETLAGRA